MAGYADVYALPLPRKNIAAYRRLARRVGRLYQEHGALEYREYVGDDFAMTGIVPFPRAIALKRSEVLVFAVVSFKSKGHRNRVNKEVARDPRLAVLAPDPPLFDARRMVYGGFAVIVEE